MPRSKEVARNPFNQHQLQLLFLAYLARGALLKLVLFLEQMQRIQLAKPVFSDRLQEAVPNSQLEQRNPDFSGT